MSSPPWISQAAMHGEIKKANGKTPPDDSGEQAYFTLIRLDLPSHLGRRRNIPQKGDLTQREGDKWQVLGVF
jgi:hypothetical protein